MYYLVTLNLKDISMFKEAKAALRFLIIFSILTGLLYPLFITAIAQVIFPYQANGSLIERNGKIIGSALIGQEFVADKYFWSRPSATLPHPYNAALGMASNLGPTNPVLIEKIKLRIKNLTQKHTQITEPIPIDLLTASASGLDPHISLAAALYQAPRVAKARKIPEAKIHALIDQISNKYFWDTFASNKINVLELNLALDELQIQGKA